MAGHVLVTGASGLLGRAVLAAMTARPGAPEAVPVRSREIDLLVPGALAEVVRRTRPAAVVHLAWIASSTPGYRTAPENGRWRSVTHEAAHAAVEAGVRFLATGSAIDASPGSDPYTEAKAGLRRDLAELIDAGQVTWLRPHYVFDPAAPSPAVLRAADAARGRGEPVALRDPFARHDFVHVHDVGEAVATALAHHLVGVVDIGLGMLTPVHTLVEKFGASWTGNDTVTTTAGSDAAADVGPLEQCGWRPTETERFLS